MKSQTVSFLRYGGIILTAFQLTACSCSLNPFAKPEITFDQVEVKDADFEKAHLIFTLIVNNPNVIGLEIKRFEYRLLIEGEEVASGHQPETSDIRAGQKTKIKIPATVQYAGAGRSLLAALQQETLAYELKGFVVLDTPIGEMRFEFEDYEFHKGDIPIPRIPKLEVKDLRIVDWGFTNIDVELVFDLHNTNDFSFQLTELRYLLQINGITVSKARVESDKKLEPESVAKFTIPINLKLINLRSGILKALRQRKVSYKLLVNVLVEAKDGDVKLPLKREGTVDIIR